MSDNPCEDCGMWEAAHTDEHLARVCLPARVRRLQSVIDGLKPIDDGLTDYVEWIVVHKGCGKPLIGMSPKNGWCYCLPTTGKPPELKEVKELPVVSNDNTLLARCEAAEKEVVKLTDKLDKASKRIAELAKKKDL